MRKLFGILPLLAVSLPGNAQNYSENDLVQLQQLNALFIDNYVTGNTARHDSILHPGFVYISPAGRYADKKTYLANWSTGFDGYVYWDYRDERISIFGNTALVRATNKYIFSKNGMEETGMALYTDTYIKVNKEWKCVQAQICEVKPDFYPGDKTIVKVYDFRK